MASGLSILNRLPAKKVLLWVVAFAIILVPLMIPGVAAAQEAGGDEGGWASSILGGIAGAGYKAIMGIIGFVAYFFLKLASVFLGIAGTLFNATINMSVFQFGQILGNSAGMLAAWGVLRDIGNIILLFGFIFMGLLIILDAHHYPVNKTIPKFILFAVLINFSLFVAEFVVDTSNAIAAAVYMESGVCAQGTSMQDCAQNTQYGISGKVMEMAGLSGIFRVNVENEIDQMTGGLATIGLTVFVTITAVVLIAAAIMLLIRMIVLAFLMVTSPIAFIGFAIPQLDGLAKDWWHNLINQSFFAPALLLMILISLKLMEGVRMALGNANSRSSDTILKAFEGAGASQATVLISFTLMIGFLIASLIIAKKMGAVGSGFATNVASSVVLGGTTRGMNLLAGGVVGSGMSRLARTIPDTPQNKAIRGGLNRAGMALKNVNLDARRIGSVSGMLSAAGATVAAQPAGHASYADMKHEFEDTKTGAWRKARIAEGNANLAVQTLEDEAHHGTLSDTSKKLLAGMNTKELEALHGIKEGVAVMARNLTPEQFENLMKSDKLDDLQKGKLRDARFAQLREAVDNGNDSEVKRWTVKDIVQSGLASNKKLADLLSDNQYDDLIKHDKVTNEQKAELKKQRESTDPADDGRFGPAKAAATLSRMSPDAIGKLSGSILIQPHIHQQLDIAEIGAIQKTGKIDKATRQAIGAHIETIARTPAHPNAATFMAYINSDPSVKQFWNIP